MNIEKLSKELSELTILEAAKLVKHLESKWGIKAENIAANPTSSENVEKNKPIEKKEFDVTLKSIGNKKIQVIKTIREITSLGLKEAKALVDSAPKLIKSNILKNEADEIKEKLEKHGALVDIQ